MSLYDSSLTPPLVINFNSKDRIQGSNSSFLSQPVDLGNNQFDSVCLVQASLPKSFYNMPSGYNTFTLRENAASATVTIPVGSYTRINLQSVLASRLTAASPNGLTYTVSYPASTVADTFHYTFTVNSSVITVQFIFTANNPYRQLGFEIATYTFTPAIGSSSLESVNSLNLSYILRAFIKTNLVLDATDGILEEVLNFGSYPASSVVHYQQYNFDMNTRRYNRSTTNSWQFSIVDAFDQLIDLNGIPWAFSVVFYQRNTTHELHKTELKITNEERLFKIEQEQKRIEEQLSQKPTTSETQGSTSTAPEGLQAPLPPQAPSINDFTPLYPVVPFGITTQFLPKTE
jgi:hypothetical protein